MIDVKLYNDQEVGELEDDLIGDRCRFCGCEDRPFVENEGRLFKNETSSRDEFWSEGPFRVRCEHCKRCGPLMKNPESAINAWNRMPNKSMDGGIK